MSIPSYTLSDLVYLHRLFSGNKPEQGMNEDTRAIEQLIKWKLLEEKVRPK
jgi:hypothetical protein